MVAFHGIERALGFPYDMVRISLSLGFLPGLMASAMMSYAC